MLPPPSPKPPYAIHGDVDITVLLSGVEIVCANRMVIKIELLMDSNYCILREDLVDENRYDNSILELAFVPFNALILYVKCSKSFAHKVAIYIFQVWNAHYVFDVMPKMLLVSLNSQIVGLISIVLDDKELLSCEFVSRYCVVGVIQFIIEVYDQLRWITCYGYVYRVLISKKRCLIPCFKLGLSQYVMNFNFSPNAHQSSWLYAFNNQSDFCDDYDLTSASSLGNITGAPIFKCLNDFELKFFHEGKRFEWFDRYVTKNWKVCRDGDMFNHFTIRNMPTVDSILQFIQVVVYGYIVVLPKILIGKHIHERWQQKSQEPHSQFGAIVDHDECEKVTLFNIGLALKTVIIFIDLEDKIIFRGVGNDIIYIVLIPCLFSNILCKEKTIGDIKVVEVKMM
jgi:hypothetical protein